MDLKNSKQIWSKSRFGDYQKYIRPEALWFYEGVTTKHLWQRLITPYLEPIIMSICCVNVKQCIPFCFVSLYSSCISLWLLWLFGISFSISVVVLCCSCFATHFASPAVTLHLFVVVTCISYCVRFASLCGCLRLSVLVLHLFTIIFFSSHLAVILCPRFSVIISNHVTANYFCSSIRIPVRPWDNFS